MPAKTTPPKPICPHLGLLSDRESHFSYPEAAHQCFAAKKATAVSLEHQESFCFAQKFSTCSLFVEPPKETVTETPSPPSITDKVSLHTVYWGLAGLFVGLLIIAGIFYYRSIPSAQTQPNNQNIQIVLNATPSPVPTENIATQTPSPSPSPVPVAFLATPTPSNTPISGAEIYSLSPETADIGWVMSGSGRGNHFGDSFMYTGIFDGRVYQGAFQFDLSAIPRGAPIYSASLNLTGLRDDRLAENIDQPSSTGVWGIRILDSQIDDDWRRHTYQDIFNAPAEQVLDPILSNQDLAANKLNIFEFSSDQIELLETRIIEDETPSISFRAEGPLVGPDNLFAWDTGYGPQSQGNNVTLVLNVGPAPATPPPYDYVVVTSTPTPESVLTAAAVALQMTADATRNGTATPLPPNLVTATPYPDYLIITPTPTPENQATAQSQATLSSAMALVTGTPSPIPTNAVTATPIPTPTPTPTFILVTSTPTPDSIFTAATLAAEVTRQAQNNIIVTPLPDNWVTPIVVTATPTPANAATGQALAQLATAIAFTTGTPTPSPINVVTATPLVYQVITSTPTPESVLTAMAMSAAATARAQQIGTATPLPDNWVTPIVVTATPTPMNSATAQAIAKMATAIALTTGTPSPTPENVVTATSTAVYESIPYLLTPQPTEPPTPTPQAIPPVLVGKVLFRSDREGEDSGYTYVFDPETGELGRLSDAWPYETARQRDSYSANGAFRAYTKQLLWTNIEEQTNDGRTIQVPTTEYAIHAYDYEYNVESIVTRMGAGIVYEPVWSPVSNKIAFVSTESGNDEIWIINHDSTHVRQLTRNDWEWDKSPSWSPDGNQIIFSSNRTGNQQLWIMNADGSDQRLLMGWDNWSPYNDWAPVWVKYPAPAPPEN